MKTDAQVARNAEEFGQEKGKGLTIRPLPLWQAALLFGIPAVLFALNYHHVALPSLSQGSLTASAASLIVPYILLLAASLVAYRLDGYAVSWSALRERFRFHKVTWRVWLLAAILFAFSLLANWFLISVRQQLNLISVPDMEYAVDTMGDNDRWLILLGMLAQVFFNVVGEEAWWRGYILPRQELTHGKYAWLVHGIMWTLFHVYQWWDLGALLPICLAIAYVSQRSKSIWPALAMHFAFNSIDLGMLILGSF